MAGINTNDPYKNPLYSGVNTSNPNGSSNPYGQNLKETTKPSTTPPKAAVSKQVDETINRFKLNVEDPTFLTFKITFLFDDIYDIHGIFPAPGLLLPATHPNSAINYLKRIDGAGFGPDFKKRFAMLEKFQTQLKDFQDNRPWFYQSISGLPEMEEFDIDGGIRNHDSEIEITMLEDLELSVTSTLDLYRKSTFDLQFMRDLLPGHLRSFQMDIHIFDVRQLAETTWVGDALQAGAKGGTARKAIITMLDNSRAILNYRLSGCRFVMGPNAALETAGNAYGDFEQARQVFKIAYDGVRPISNYTLKKFILDDAIGRVNMNKEPDFTNPVTEITDFGSLDKIMQTTEKYPADKAEEKIREKIKRKIEELARPENRNILLNEIRRTINHLTGLDTVDLTEADIKRTLSTPEIDLYEVMSNETLEDPIDPIQRETNIRTLMTETNMEPTTPPIKDDFDQSNAMQISRTVPGFSERTEELTEAKIKDEFARRREVQAGAPPKPIFDIEEETRLEALHKTRLTNVKENRTQAPLITSTTKKIVLIEARGNKSLTDEEVDFTTFTPKTGMNPKIIDFNE